VTRTADLKFIRILNTQEVYKTLELAEKMLPEGGTHTFVIENFRADVNNVSGRQGRTKSAGMFQWSEMKTSQLIGTLTYAAYRMNQSPVILQEPGQVLTMGRVWCDLPVPKKGHIPDDKSAYIHGAHYMMNAGLIDSVDDILKNGQERLL
jgi:hypothetical protein